MRVSPKKRTCWWIKTDLSVCSCLLHPILTAELDGFVNQNFAMGFWAQRLGLLPLLSLSHLLPGSLWTPEAFHGCVNRAEHLNDHGSNPAESKQALNQLCSYRYGK